MSKFAQNISGLLDHRSISHAAFSRMVVKKFGRKSHDSIRRRITRICSGTTYPSLRDVEEFASTLNVLPGLLAFCEPEKFKNLYYTRGKINANNPR